MEMHDIDIIMVTYNQEAYIKQSIESVLMQEGLISYKLIICDDCSTDRTGQICISYEKLLPDIIKYIRGDENVGVAGNYRRAFNACTAKYVAILEGDDFYTDRYKLKKQIVFLEKNPGYGLIHSNYYVLYACGRKKIGHTFKDKNHFSGMLFDKLLEQNIICPATTCFRRDLFERYVDFDFAVRNELMTIDIFIWLAICKNSETYYQNEIMSTWRMSDNSISNNANTSKYISFVESSLLIYKYYYEKYYIQRENYQRVVAKMYLQIVRWCLFQNDYVTARKYLPFINLMSIETVYLRIMLTSRIFFPLFKINYYVRKQASNMKQYLYNKTIADH